MPSMSRTERAELCDLALQVGEDQPTLCEGWTVKDLVVHLLIREGSPAAVGIALSPVARLTAWESRRLARRDLAVLVERLRHGPPAYSPLALPKLEPLVNTVEYFVHHEDIRRAQPDWSPRVLDDDAEKTLWSMVRTAGKGLTRGAPVGVTLENATTGSLAVLKRGAPTVTVRGLPSELTLFVFGRRPQAEVELRGDDDAVARLSEASLGI
jgi:uncharacterized protein (TIGR03085 family)